MLNSLAVGDDDRDETTERVRRRSNAVAARLLPRALGFRVWIAEAELGRWNGEGRVESNAEGLDGNGGSIGGTVSRGNGDGEDCMSKIVNG